jgi:hypothetical protein
MIDDEVIARLTLDTRSPVAVRDFNVEFEYDGGCQGQR